MKPVLNELDEFNYAATPVDYLAKLLVDSFSSRETFLEVYKRAGIVCELTYSLEYYRYCYYFPELKVILVRFPFEDTVFKFDNKTYVYYYSVKGMIDDYGFFILEGEK